MLICLYGTDTYRRKERARAIISAFRLKHPQGVVEWFDGSDPAAPRELRVFVSQQSLFSRVRLGVVEYPTGEREELAACTKAHAAADCTLVLLADALPKGLPREARTEEFVPLEDRAAAAFIRRAAEARGLALMPETVLALGGAYSDLWGVMTELDVMALGRTFASEGARPAFFPLIQGLRARNLPDRLASLAVLSTDEEPAKAFHVLASLLDPGGKATMADYDIAVKSGKLEYEECLLDFVLSREG